MTHMAGVIGMGNGYEVLNEVDDENEQNCIEAPVENVDGDIPMTDEWVDFTYEVFWYVFKCGPVAGCRWLEEICDPNTLESFLVSPLLGISGIF